MAKLTMIPAASRGQGGATSPHTPVGLTHTPVVSTTDVFPNLGSIESVRGEIDDAFADSKEFYQREPDEVIQMVMGHSARLSELRTQVMRIEVIHRQWKPIRTELESCLEELRNQFQYASRLLFSRELDLKIEAGGRIT